MAAYMKNPTALVKQIHTVQHFLAEYIQPPLKRKGREFLTGFYIMFISLNIHGRPKLARPIIIASTPYRSKHSLARCGVVISPFPMIGICIRGFFLLHLLNSNPLHQCTFVHGYVHEWSVLQCRNLVIVLPNLL